MGGVNSSTARSWRVEFKRNDIGEKELIKIRDNLNSLKNPEFIPNSLTLIGLLKATECRTNLGITVDPDSLPDEKEILENRVGANPIRKECMSLLGEILNTKYKDREESDKNIINDICPGPTDKMVRLIRNHNRLLIAQGLSPINMPNCRSRAIDMGLE